MGVNCGILDQYTSVLAAAGHAVLLDCRHLTHLPVPVPAGVTVVICDTRAKRTLAGTEYAARRAQCEEGVRLLQRYYPKATALRDVSGAELAAHESDLPVEVARRCRFIVEENARVLELGHALAAADHAAIATLTAASFAGARKLYEIVSPEMAWMLSAMTDAPGVIGARQAGAGFGGCLVAFVDGPQVPAFTAHVAAAYLRASDIRPQVYPVQPAPGAGALRRPKQRSSSQAQI